MFIVTYVVQITIVKGPSMLPTLQENNRLIIEKLTPRFGKLQFGDIVTINVPEFQQVGRETIIKRVIGVEGDNIELKEGKVYVNGKALAEDYTNGTYTPPIEPQYSKVTVQKGQIYVLGDNRTNSKDSRTIGLLDIKKVSGKVIVRIYPFNEVGKLNK